MISWYKFKKYAVFISVLAVPLVIFFLLFFMIGLKHYELEKDFFITVLSPIDTLICIIVSIAIGGVIIFIGNRFLRHPILNMLEGKGLLTWVLDSTGLIHTFNVIVDAPKVIGKKPGLNNVDLDETYDKDLMHRIVFPKDVPYTTGYEVSRDGNGNAVVTEKKILVLPDKEEQHEHYFKFESIPVYIYNKVLGQFLSRDLLAKNEKDIQLKHGTLNILQKLTDIANQFRDFGRYAGELTKPKKTGLFARLPWLKWALIGIIIVFIIMIILMFVPGFMEAGSRLGPP